MLNTSSTRRVNVSQCNLYLKLSIQAFAGKSDLFRMALLFREGGFHTDWKTVCLQQNLLDQIANSSDFFAPLDYGGGFVKKSVRLVFLSDE